MDWQIHKSVTLEGWMDRQLASEKPLSEEEQRRWYGHILEKSSELPRIEYCSDSEEYKRIKTLWVCKVRL